MGRFASAALGSQAEPLCSLGAYIDSLPEGEAEELAALMRERSYNFIVRLILDVDGRSFAKETVSRHARGMCKCRAS